MNPEYGKATIIDKKLKAWISVVILLKHGF